MKATYVVGTRPEIIKASSVLQASAARGWSCQIIHTGQHYDHAMSEVFFHDLALPQPDVFLGVGSGSAGRQTGAALANIEAALVARAPDIVLVVGDTNSTLAGALAAAKLGIAVAHIEAGMRSYDWSMPEELNRRLTDAVATLCLAPTPRALEVLQSEGRGPDAYLVGDTLVEAAGPAIELAREKSRVLDQLGLAAGRYALLTLHRPENVDVEANIRAIVEMLEAVDYPIVFPMHPRAKKMLETFDLLARIQRRAMVVPPCGYLDFLRLADCARLVITDSGGVQQESSILRVPCVTVRYNTEWIETVECGHNTLVGREVARGSEAIRGRLFDEDMRRACMSQPCPFSPGAGTRIVSLLDAWRARGAPSYARSNFLRDGLPTPATSTSQQAQG